MTETKKVELWVVFNEDGDMEADTDLGTALEKLTENFGGHQIRELKLTFVLPAIAVPEATITVPEAAPAEAAPRGRKTSRLFTVERYSSSSAGGLAIFSSSRTVVRRKGDSFNSTRSRRGIMARSTRR